MYFTKLLTLINLNLFELTNTNTVGVSVNERATAYNLSVLILPLKQEFGQGVYLINNSEKRVQTLNVPITLC